MRDIDLKSLRLFAAVCDNGNIKAAAAQEHIEPSAISKRLAQLEDQLGIQLLVRGRMGAELTPAGQALGATQQRHPQTNVPFVHWPLAVLDNTARGAYRYARPAAVSARPIREWDFPYPK